VRERSCSC